MSELQAPAGDRALDLSPEELAHSTSPRHVAIIMDGNHRWAKQRHLPGAAGHRAGARNLKPIAQACADRGVEYLTLFAFSTENWNRPSREVKLLLEIMRRVLEEDVDELCEKGVRLKILGDPERFSADLQMLMKRAEQMTRDNSKLTLSLAVNYGGRWDIVAAAREIARAATAGRIDPDSIDESLFQQFLSLGEVPAPDLCIRTGGEHRISNFLLWDLAYSELFFTEAFWPDFDAAALDQAIQAFHDRERRFGRRV